MKELVVISGKGGTGKTSITASLSVLCDSKVMVDCDVDAADMHLILRPEVEKTEEFYGGKQAHIDNSKCVKCGKCEELCKFDAIENKANSFNVNEINCEGCGVCYHFCPVGAIEFEDKLSGLWYESNTRFGKFIHAKLGVAEENSGKLVTKIRNAARLVAHNNKNDLIIVDGSPGIGCPVIASISGANFVLVVTEPTLSGIHDSKRVIELANHFKIPTCVCINKYDINPEVSRQMEKFCKANNIEVVGKIPYDKNFTDAQIKELTVVEYSDNQTSKEIKKMWKILEEKLEIRR